MTINLICVIIKEQNARVDEALSAVAVRVSGNCDVRTRKPGAR